MADTTTTTTTATTPTTTTATTPTTTNGIDVPRLVETIESIGDDPSLGAFTFRARSTWQEGTYNVGRIGWFRHAGAEDQSRAASFVLHGDEPPVLLGANKGPNAVELLLQGLAFCYAVGFAANAAAKGIEISSMDYEVEGDVDVRPFLGMEGPRPGLTRIRATGRVSSPNATREQLDELWRHVQETSPVRDSLANPVAVEATLEVVDTRR
jgi:uncharacterized OsmC-like protein